MCAARACRFCERRVSVSSSSSDTLASHALVHGSGVSHCHEAHDRQREGDRATHGHAALKGFCDIYRRSLYRDSSVRSVVAWIPGVIRGAMASSSAPQPLAVPPAFAAAAAQKSPRSHPLIHNRTASETVSQGDAPDHPDGLTSAPCVSAVTTLEAKFENFPELVRACWPGRGSWVRTSSLQTVSCWARAVW